MNAYTFSLKRGWEPTSTALAWPDGESFEEFLAATGHRDIEALSLGRVEGFGVRVFESKHGPAYLVEVGLGGTLEYVLVADLPSLLRLLADVSPIVTASLASDAADAAAASRPTPSRRPLGNKCGNIGALPDPWTAPSRHGNGGRK